VIGALHTPDDGHVDPANVTMALATGARQLGARIIRRCRATDITRLPNGEWKVETEQGDIVCEHVVNAGGTYARQMGEWSGLQLPMTSMTHHYLVTDTVPEFRDLERELPVIRDDKKVSGYIRMEQKSGLIGIYEKANPNTVWEDHCPWEAENELFEADYDRIMPWLENAMERMPIFAELGIKREVHGAISHPPDGNPLIGPAPGARNYWCCCGTQIGIGWGPGLTRELARWMVHGAADISMRDYDPRRFGPYATKEWQVIKAKEDYCLRHEIPFPHFNRLAGRPVKPSPLYERLKAKGAVFEEVYGHERPRWFARHGLEQRDHYGFRRTPVHDMVAAECQAVRERAGLMDISAFTKVEVSGPDAEALVDRLVANRLPQKPGGIALTHMLNRRGRIELETTVVRMARRPVLSGLRGLLRAAPDRPPDLQSRGGADATSSTAPRTGRRSRCNGTEGAGHPWRLYRCQPGQCASAGCRRRRSRSPGIRCGRCACPMRGELGWELHGPREHLPAVYDALWAAGERTASPITAPSP
jgi:dimethylglycine dehydrogenase